MWWILKKSLHNYVNSDEIMKEFYPLDNWQALEEIILHQSEFSDCESSGKTLSEDELKALNTEVNRMLLKASAALQANSEWIPARESITQQHRVEVSLTPTGMTRPITFTVDMSNPEAGFEDKILGKSTQSVPSKFSFIVGKVNSKHALYNFAGKQLGCTLAIQNVFKPPFKMNSIGTASTLKEWQKALLENLREIPFKLCEGFAQVMGQQVPQTPLAKTVLMCIGNFLLTHSQVPKGFTSTTQKQILELGAKFDPEMELSFVESLYRVFVVNRNRYSPPTFQKNIENLFVERFDIVVNNIVSQMTQQQKEIRQRLSNFAEVEVERQRLLAMAQEMEVQKKKGAGDEVLRRARTELQKLASRIQRKIRQYESSKGIILIQELYISAIEKSEHLKSSLEKMRKEMNVLKGLLKANHISAARDIESLTHSLGVHGQHLLVQHAIYSEIEPDLNHLVSIDALVKYDDAKVRPLLNLIPTVREALVGQELNSNNLLKAIFTADVPEREKNAFLQFCEENPEPRDSQTQRFSQQTEQFIQISRASHGLEGVADFLEKELLCLKSILRFAAEQNKLNTDFKNHMRYYEKIFIEPYLSLLTQSAHAKAEDMERTLEKLSNSLKVQMEIRYSVLEEKALLSMFKSINGQLQNENLFAAKVFAKQVRNFMNQLTRFKDNIPPVLMKKILETYTIYMMGSSRTRNLSNEKAGLSQEELQKIRANRDSLTT